MSMAELKSQVTFRVTEKTYERIKEIAQMERRKPNEVARALLERGEAAYNRDGKLFEPETEARQDRRIPYPIKPPGKENKKSKRAEGQ